jgi:hypothetical protein
MGKPLSRRFRRRFRNRSVVVLWKKDLAKAKVWWSYIPKILAKPKQCGSPPQAKAKAEEVWQSCTRRFSPSWTRSVAVALLKKVWPNFGYVNKIWKIFKKKKSIILLHFWLPTGVTWHRNLISFYHRMLQYVAIQNPQITSSLPSAAALTTNWLGR